tara:strand:- start:1264 stop:1656 length:393 start_codon:yes stop_codon:yes gene_type:complete
MTSNSKPKNIKTIEKKSKSNKKETSDKSSGIPKEVANRMARRIAITTGIPTFGGMSTFIVSYILVSKGLFDIPPGVTLLISAGCFIVGLIGLSYGILSASWEKSKGSLLGLENIKPNVRRMKEAFTSLNK